MPPGRGARAPPCAPTEAITPPPSLESAVMALDSGNYLGRRLPAGLILLGVGAGAPLLLAPEGSGGDTPVRVQTGASVSLYRSVTEAVEGTPSWLHTVLEAVSEATVAALAVLLVVVWAVAVLRRDGRVVAGTMALGLGTVGAYALSEWLKVLVYEERPCRSLADAANIGACPSLGDWSFPSNHTCLAMGTAVGLTVLLPRLAPLALPLGLGAAVLRVAVGVHYPHDVLAGLLLGSAFSLAALLILAPPLTPVATAVLGRLGRDRAASAAAADGGRAPLDP